VSDETPSGSPPEPPGADSASAEAPAAANAPIAPVEPRCKCGAGPHPDREGFCANSHPFKGHGGKLSTTHGLHVKRPPVLIDVSSTTARAAVILKVFESTTRHAVRLADAADRNVLRPRDGAALMQALDRLVAIEPQVRALAPSPDGGDGEAPAHWPQRLALIFANQPDHFTEFARALLEADRDRCGPLRVQLRLVLDHFDPKGIPVWRGKKSEDDDVVLL